MKVRNKYSQAETNIKEKVKQDKVVAYIYLKDDYIKLYYNYPEIVPLYKVQSNSKCFPYSYATVLCIYSRSSILNII